MFVHLRLSLLASSAAAAALLLGSAPVPAAAATNGVSAAPQRMPIAGHFRHAASTATASTAPMASGGGAIQTTPAVYLSYWGPQWQSGFSTGGYSSAAAQNYLQQFFSGVGGSSWIASTEQYCQGVAAGVTVCPSTATFVGSAAGQLKGTWVDTTAVPATPVDADIQHAAERAFQHFGITANATYFVITPTGQSASGFGSQWCAWHSSDYYSGRQVAYAYLPYMPDAGASCGRNYVNATNDAFGHGYFDGFSIVGGHEYAEAITDPNPSSGWTDVNGDENGDKCQWSAGPAGDTTLSSGSFAVQSLWSNAAGGCVLSVSSPAPPPPAPPPPAPAPPPASCSQPSGSCGYDILTSFGGIYSFGDAHYYGNLIDHNYPGPAVSLATTPSARGYAILNSAGAIYTFGDAAYYGNLIDHSYPGPAVALSMTPTGRGYAILTASGGIYTFGDARYFGNLIDHGYPGPAVSLSYTPSGNGYAILTGSGAIYTFGDAAYFGNLLDHGYPGPAVALAMTASGRGYSILNRAGAIYSFGDAVYFGNLLDHGYPGPAVSLANTQ